MSKIHEFFYNKIIFLKPLGDTYQAVGKKYFKSAETISFKKKSFKVPKFPSRLNKYGKLTYYLDFDTGNQITYSHAKHKDTFTSKEIDLFLKRGLVENFVRSFRGVVTKDYVMLLMSLGCGVGIGFIIAFLLFRGF